MKLGPLTKYQEKHFSSKIIHKLWWKLFPDSFLKNQNWAYLWINSLRFYTIFLSCNTSCQLSKYIETKLQNFFLCLIWSFLKTQKRSITSLSASFSARFFKKNASLIICNYLTKLHCLVTFTSWDIGLDVL